MKEQLQEVQQGPEKKQKAPYHIAKRERRNPFRVIYNNDRKPKGTGFLNMGIAWDGRVIFFPKRKKFKGYQKCK